MNEKRSEDSRRVRNEIYHFVIVIKQNSAYFLCQWRIGKKNLYLDSNGFMIDPPTKFMYVILLVTFMSVMHTYILFMYLCILAILQFPWIKLKKV